MRCRLLMTEGCRPEAHVNNKATAPKYVCTCNVLVPWQFKKLQEVQDCTCIVQAACKS